MRKRKHTFFQFFMIILSIAAGVFCLKFLMLDRYETTLQSNYEMISKHFTGTGKLLDVQNELGLNNDPTSNIKVVFMKNGDVVIHFGSIDLIYKSKSDFLSEENLDKLKKIFITYKVDKEGAIHFYFRGEEVDTCYEN